MKNEPSVPAASSEDALKKLKAILLEPDQQKIKRLEEELTALRKRFEDKEKFLQALKPVIVKALDEKIAGSREEMAKALAPVMGPAIKKQIAEAQDEVVDALYPVIGATIRKSVAEAMKNLARTVNEKMDKALSFHLLFQKIKARISGVSEAEVLLKETFPFRIHEIFFIHRDSGVLLQHISGGSPLSTDGQDIIAGMLTAIRDFASTAFKTDSQQEVNEIQYNDFQIILGSGRAFYLAVVISGVPNQRFYSQLETLSHSIHTKFAGQLRHFDGDSSKFEESKPLLEKFIIAFDTPIAVEKDRKPRGILYLAILTVLVIAFYFTVIYEPKEPVALQHAVEPAIRQTVDFANFVQAVNKETGMDYHAQDAPFKLIFEPDFVIITGTVPSENVRRAISKTAAQMSIYPVIVNEVHVKKTTESTLTLKEKINNSIFYFGLDQTDLTAAHKNKLDSIAVWLKRLNYKILKITGHSDNTGDEQFNIHISRQRAERVFDYLIEKGIATDKLSITGLGSKMPIASNALSAGREKNRRVELHIEE